MTMKAKPDTLEEAKVNIETAIDDLRAVLRKYDEFSGITAICALGIFAARCVAKDQGSEQVESLNKVANLIADDMDARVAEIRAGEARDE